MLCWPVCYQLHIRHVYCITHTETQLVKLYSVYMFVFPPRITGCFSLPALLHFVRACFGSHVCDDLLNTLVGRG